MSKFKYTLPSGAAFTVTGPADATQSQADEIFYSQVAAGALVGFQSGQSLISHAIYAKMFTLSRMDRGTAGDAGATQTVSTTGTVTNPLTTDSSVVTNIVQNLPQIPNMPRLEAVPVQNPVTQADIVQTYSGLGAIAVGPLNEFAVQALQAQTAKLVGQPYYEMTLDKGIGKYGFTCYQLEKAGYVKPTTQARFIDPNPSVFISVMQSQTIWLGRDNVTSVDQILANEDLQNKIQNELMQAAWQALNASGAVSMPASDAVSTTTSWVFGSTGLAPAGYQPVAKTASVRSGVTIAVDGAVDATSYSFNTASATLTAQVNRELGALVVNGAKFGPELTTLWASNGAKQAARLPLTSNTQTNVLMHADLRSTSLTSQYITSRYQSQAQASLTNPVTSIVNSDPTFSNFSLDGLRSIPGSVADQLNNQLSNSVGNLNVFGKASEYSMNFADVGKQFDEFTNLDKLGDIANKGLDNMTTSLTSSYNNITGELSKSFDGLTKSFDDTYNSLSTGLDKLSDIDFGSMKDLGKMTDKLFGAGGLSGLTSKLGDLTKLFGGSNNPLIANIKVAAAFSDTVSRDTVDAAVQRVIGSGKIPDPTFGLGGTGTGMMDDIASAKETLSGLSNRASSVVSDTRSILAQNGVTGYFG